MSFAGTPVRWLRLPKNDRICLPCLRKLSRRGLATRRHASTSLQGIGAITAPRNTHSSFGERYFLSNNLWDTRFSKQSGFKPSRANTTAQSITSPTPTAESVPQEAQGPPIKETALPHRRRKRKISEEAAYPIPHDASARLAELSSTFPLHSLRQRALTYLSLSKPRLTFLIILTTTSAYSLFPVAVSPFSTALSLSPWTLLNLTTGTALSCACANALNMLMEPKYDAMMTRTRNRPLVRGLITPRGALAFALLTGAAGLALLTYGVNPTVAFLSGLNIVLYAGVYTPLKRLSILNTWAGALVGGIPPLMGWAAAAGQQALADPSTLHYDAADSTPPGWRDLLFDPATSPGGWLLAALLYVWQFPHFNSLSHSIRHEYAAAGYKMLASVDTARSARIALRYAALTFPICAGLAAVGVTGWAFVGTSGVVNAWMLRGAWRFWRLEGAKGSARGLFWASVWHLPLVLVLAMVHKRGLWERLVRGGMDDDELEEVLMEEQYER